MIIVLCIICWGITVAATVDIIITGIINYQDFPLSKLIHGYLCDVVAITVFTTISVLVTKAIF